MSDWMVAPWWVAFFVRVTQAFRIPPAFVSHSL